MAENSDRAVQLSPVKQALLALEKMQARLEAAERRQNEPIAIVGMGCRFPGGADTPEKYWDLLARGVDAITDIPPSRWDIERYYDPNPEAPGKMYVKSGGFLEDVEQFDSWFFRISPREAVSLDPQQRLLLEVSWEALEHAGLAADRLAGTSTGIFVGITTNDYAQLLMRACAAGGLDAYYFTGNPMNTAAGRLAYTFGFHGPAIAMDTACSSSLVSVHQACVSLRNRECNMALAGGVNLVLIPENTVAVCRTRALSPDGHCRTFDRAANGFVRSEGCGIVALKRLSDAVANGDTIHAVIRGSAVNQDGASSGFTVPNGKAQEALIRQALGSIAPAQIDYLEAHGTGTPLGDPIEIAAAAAAFGEGRHPSEPLYVGSVKSNIGHCEAAAGIAGLIKVILSLQRRQIPRHLHFTDPSPLIPWDSLPIEIPVQTIPWTAAAKTRLAAISAFGASGTNAHMILEEAPAAAVVGKERERSRHILLVSAKTADGLNDQVMRYKEYLAAYPDVSVADVCHSAATGRVHFRHRISVVAGSVTEAVARLEDHSRSHRVPETDERQQPRIAFLFTGQGAQYAGMGRVLYETHPGYRATIDHCSDILEEGLHVTLPEILFGTASASLSDTAYTQPALFALEYALAELLKSWGIRPAAVLGHSVGEYVAACVAGVMSLEDGLRLITRRAQLMNALPRGGGMAAVLADAGQILDVIRPFAHSVTIASFNAPRNTVISGKVETVAMVCEQLAKENVRSIPLDVSHAFHSPLIEPMLDRFESAAAQISFAAPGLTLISNVTGQAISEAPNAQYWRHHCRQPVRFAEGVDALFGQGCDVFIEIGPKPTLMQLARQCRSDMNALWLPSLAAGADDWQVLLETMGALYSRGVNPDWLEFDRPYQRRRLAIPTYAFQRRRYWVQEGEAAGQRIEPRAAAAHTAQVVRKHDSVLATLCKHVAELLHAKESDINIHLPFLELGADSLVMVEAIGLIENEFGLKVEIRRFFEDLSTIDALATHIQKTLPVEAKSAAQAATAAAAAVAAPAVSTPPQAVPAVPAHAMPWGNAAEVRARGLTPGQHQHLEALIERYTRRTKRSRQLTEQTRAVLADSRATVGFRLSTKEMLYPITADRTAGSRMWDVDGNEYIDFTMGFGVHLFGHKPSFIQPAVAEELERGVELGARSDLVGEVATLFTELTGLDRVAFCNSGTEAVMAAIRLARAGTGRDKIAVFTNSYHGHADATLARAHVADGRRASIPMAPGVPAKTAENVLVLDYGAEESLEILRGCARELAAVLVEPVQSRHLGLQPREFLHELRRITSASGSALVFDEMITGFRVHLGGAQAYFGVKADIATYGKIVGGGLPIGLVAGSAAFLDGIDGGQWQYGDGSFPAANRTAFGGTFCQHPLAMAAARAVLRHLKTEGPALQERLNDRTSRLCQSLNKFFSSEGLPITASHFSSLFRFDFSTNLDLLFYHMLERGIYIWEWRSCFLSTAHSDSDVDAFVQTVRESVDEMRSGDFLPKRIRASAPQADLVPLSEAQKQLWLLALINKLGSLAYNVNTTVELAGPLNLAAMEAAIQGIVDRHSALRTTISSDGQHQRVHSEFRVPLPLTDFSALSGGARTREVEAWRRKESAEPIDLVRGPLFRPHLLRLEEELHVLVLTLHHVVADGTTMGVLLKDLSVLYNEIRSGPTMQHPAPMQFHEYLKLCEQRRETSAMRAHETFWTAQFAGGVPALNLPLDRMRTAMRTYNGARIELALAADLTAALKQLSRKSGCTLYMTLLSAFALLLHRYCRQDEVIVGTPVAGRPFRGSTDMAGYCTHLMPVRSVLQPDFSFLDLLQSVKNTLLDAFEHQDFPFADLVKKLEVPRDAASFPIVSAVFNLEPALPNPAMEGIAIRLLPQVVGFTSFDLFLNVIEGPDQLSVTADFNTDLFDEGTVRRMAQSYETLIRAIVEAPSMKAAQLPLLTGEENHRLLAEWNNTAAAYDERAFAHTLFEAAVARAPQAVAVTCEGRELTYGELNRRSNQLAHYLRSRGVGPDVLVGVCAERSLELIVAVLGVLKAGGAYVPIDPECPKERVEFMVGDAGMPVMLVQSKCVGLLAAYQGELVRLDSDWQTISAASDENLEHHVGPENLSFVIYTSGSTGRPKGALNTHCGLSNLLFWSQDVYGLTTEDRVLHRTPISFDVSVWELLWPLMAGARLCMARPGAQRDVEYLAKFIGRNRITLAVFVPSILKRFLEEPEVGDQCRDLRVVIATGEVLSLEVQRRFFSVMDSRIELHNGYGPAEAAVVVTYCKCDGNGNGTVVPIGRPLANTELYILDDLFQPLPVGVAGELFIGGANVGRGYLNRPELSVEKFIPDPFSGRNEARLYRSGDLARYRPDGVVDFLGRLDHQIKIHGVRMELGEIDAVLCEYPEVKAAATILRKDDSEEPCLISYVASNLPQDEIERPLREHLKRALPRIMVPSNIVVLQSLPRLPNGKLDRNQLPAVAASESYVPPADEVEAGIAAVWGEVLRKHPVSVVADFFAIGGNSLSATQVVVRINRNLNANIGIRDVFTYPTVRELAGKISRGNNPDYGPIQPLSEQDSYELSHAQMRFWIQDRIADPRKGNSHPLSLLIEGSLDNDIFKRAFEMLVARHEILRTVFVESDGHGRPRQKVLATGGAKFEVNVVDWTGISDVEASIRAIESNQASTRMDLGNGPLLRVDLIRVNDERCVCVCSMHHIVIDGWSVEVLLNEMTTLYDALAGKQPDPLPPMKIQYKDYAAWQNRILESAMASEMRTYWSGKLDGDMPSLHLPADFSRSAENGYKRAVCRFTLPREVVQKLNATARMQGATLFMALLACIKALLYRYTAQEDICVGTPVAGRIQPELENQIGPYLNILPLRDSVAADDTFAAVLQQVRQTTLDAYANQFYPFDLILAGRSLERNAGRNLLFDVGFTLQNQSEAHTRQPSRYLRISEIVRDADAIQDAEAVTDFWFVANDDDGNLKWDVVYNGALFKPETAERLVQDLQAIVSAAGADAEVKVGAIPLAGAQGRRVRAKVAIDMEL